MTDRDNKAPEVARSLPALNDVEGPRGATHGLASHSLPFLAKLASSIRRFFTGAGLPIFVIAAVLVYEAFLLAVVLVPQGSGLWAAFVTDFKTWCFNYDPRTGGMEWMAFVVMLLEPFFVAVIAAFVWRTGLSALRTPAGWARHWRAGTMGVVMSAICVFGLFVYGAGETDADELLPFPGERIRTQLVPPTFRLADQNGEPFSLEDMRGRVVLATGIYAMCSTSCPQILIEIRKLLDGLPAENRARLNVVAFSLNPEYETTKLMSALVEGYGFEHPEFRYLNGDPEIMHDLLSQLQFARFRDERTGIIEHSNLFLLIDAKGRIAYRFSLDARHLPWLREAVLALTDETPPANAALVAR